MGKTKYEKRSEHYTPPRKSVQEEPGAAACMYAGCPWPNNVCPKQPRFLLSGIQTLNNGATSP